MKGDIDFVYGLFGPEYIFLTKTTIQSGQVYYVPRTIFIYFDGQHFVVRIVWLNEKTFFEYFN